MSKMRRTILKALFGNILAFLFVSSKTAEGSVGNLGEKVVGSTTTLRNNNNDNLNVTDINKLIYNFLSSPDRMKNIGRCNSIAILRSIEPTLHGQKIEVISYYDDWESSNHMPCGGGEFFYDANDKISLDDGGACIVSVNGARWKRTILGTVLVQEFGAKGDGVINGNVVSGTDDSDSFYRALNYVCSRHINTSSSNPIAAVSIKIDSDKGFFRINQARKFIGDVESSNRLLGLKYFSDNRATIFFDNNTDNAELIFNNNKYLFLRFYGLRFESNNFNSICHFSYSDHGGAQDCYYFDCDFGGTWKSLLKLRGKNNNSEFGWEMCSISGRYIDVWDISDSDQFLNYWAHKCKFWIYAGSHINANQGGHFKFVDCDWSGIGVNAVQDYTLFKLNESNHARGVCDFRIINGRFEIRSLHVKFLESMWNYGNIELVIDLSSQASIELSKKEMFTFTKGNFAGPKITIRDSQICGLFRFIDSSSNEFFLPNSIAIENCQFWYVNNLDGVFNFFLLHKEKTLNQWICKVINSMTFANERIDNITKICSINGNYCNGPKKIGSFNDVLLSISNSNGEFPRLQGDIVLDLPINAHICQIYVHIPKSSSADSYNYQLTDGVNSLMQIKGSLVNTYEKTLDTYYLIDDKKNSLKFVALNDISSNDGIVHGECIIRYF
jgi:hypothetical protein